MSCTPLVPCKLEKKQNGSTLKITWAHLMSTDWFLDKHRHVDGSVRFTTNILYWFLHENYEGGAGFKKNTSRIYKKNPQAEKNPLQSRYKCYYFISSSLEGKVR